MKKLVALLTFALLISSAYAGSDDHSNPKRVVIAGKVKNMDPNNLEVKLAVNQLALGQAAVYAKADSLGNFHASFETYIPTDVWIIYKTNFLVMVQPGDSIYVEFDGKHKDRPQLLETIKFDGDGSKTNQDAAKFQSMYFSSTLYHDWDAKMLAIKNYDHEDYLLHLDSIGHQFTDLYNGFLVEVQPDENVKIWAKTFIEQEYYDALSMYPREHARANNLKDEEWSVPENFYDKLLDRLPIERNMLVSGYAISGFINSFHYNYSRKKTRSEELIQKYKTPEGHIVAPKEIIDSINVYGIIKHTPDTLLRQMVLTEFFQQNLENSEIDIYEQYKNIVDTYILEPFLREPLFEQYKEVKNRIENPQIATDAYLKKFEDATYKELFDSVLTSNKGKVVYVNFWATWCGPCKAEIPHSKRLMEEMKEKDVAFVYICIDSKEELWKADLANFQIGGQHYYLTNEQSTAMRKAFEIQGIPYYLLIDQEGVILEKGSHLRPGGMKSKLLGVLGN
ncbi:TlpA family protein disulfide reductase [Belliella marina]|uniref:TlpA family protein disulfide reductase n=1 Tax=Belliella marina TaxID=1644146 RepID=A0ABW4VQF8_9BACT